jgi:hypothetical protein
VRQRAEQYGETKENRFFLRLLREKNFFFTQIKKSEPLKSLEISLKTIFEG